MTFHWPKKWTLEKFKEYKKKVDEEWDEEAYNRHRDIPKYILHQEERLKKVEAIQKFDNRAYKLNGGDVLDAIIERAKKK